MLEAARIAADRLALSLGLTPDPEPTTEPGLATLLQLRVVHALGDPSVWRLALADAQALAGLREIPAALRTAPPARHPGTSG